MNAPSERVGRAVGRPGFAEPSRYHWTVSREELGRRGSDLTEAEIRHVERTLNDHGGYLRSPNFERGLRGGLAGFMTFVAGGGILETQGAPAPVYLPVAGLAAVGAVAAMVIRPGALEARRVRKDLRASLRGREIEFSQRELDLLSRAQEARQSASTTHEELRRLDADSAGPALDLFAEEWAIMRRIYAAARLRTAYAGAEGDEKALQSLDDVLAAASDSVDALEAYGQRLTQVLDTLREIERLKIASDASGELLDLVTERGLDDFRDSAVARSTVDLVARQEGLQYLVKMLEQDVEHLRGGGE